MLPVFRATSVAWVPDSTAEAHARAAAAHDQVEAAARAAFSRSTVAYTEDPAAASGLSAAGAAGLAAGTVGIERYLVANGAAAAVAAAARAAAAYGVATFWSAVSFDATRVEKGANNLGSPLWPLHPVGPENLMSLWNGMEAALLAEKQDWMV